MEKRIPSDDEAYGPELKSTIIGKPVMLKVSLPFPVYPVLSRNTSL
jgi:hypothetical protein